VSPAGEALDGFEAALRRAGVGPVRQLSPGDAHGLFPYLAPGLAGVHVASTARVEGEEMRRRLLDAAIAGGAELVTGRAELLCGEDSVEGIRVEGRRMDAGQVLVAAGTWSAQLLAGAGIEIPLAPQRGQIVHLGVARDTAGMPAVGLLVAHHYLLPFPDRRIVVGATRETGSGFEARLTAGGVAEVLHDALGVAPGLADATVRELRTGLRPVTPDGDPILGPVPGCAGLWVATGMGPSGLTLGPYCGSLLADAMTGRPVEVDLTPLAPSGRGQAR
jgi:D-amino-acid dehydrogenase